MREVVVNGLILTQEVPPFVERCKPTAIEIPKVLTYTFPAASHKIFVHLVSVVVLGSNVQVIPWSVLLKTPTPPTPPPVKYDSPVQKYIVLVFVGSWQIPETARLLK